MKRLFIGLLVLGALSAPLSSTVNPHYDRLLRKGIEAYQGGSAIEAVETIRLACFGMLTEPSELGACLAHLTIAQSRSGDRAGLASTWSRVNELEDRFEFYETAPLDPATRADFERILAASVSATELARWPVFAAAPESAPIDEIDALKPRKRRRELERRVASDPTNPQWGYLLAKMDAEAGDPAESLKRLTTVLAGHPEHSASRCLAAGLAAEVGDDATAAEHYALCEAVSTDPGTARGYLETLARSERWDRAVAVYEGLEEAARSGLPRDDLTEQLAALAALNRAALDAEQSRSDESPTADMGGGNGFEALGAAAVEPTLDLATEIERLRAQSLSADSLEALDTALAEAEQLANAHPESTDAQLLAAEIAYRASDWDSAVSHFERAGEISRSQPLLLFYKSVALYEIGRVEEAATTLRSCLARVRRTPYVQGYIDKILPEAAGG